MHPSMEQCKLCWQYGPEDGFHPACRTRYDHDKRAFDLLDVKIARFASNWLRPR